MTLIRDCRDIHRPRQERRPAGQPRADKPPHQKTAFNAHEHGYYLRVDDYDRAARAPTLQQQLTKRIIAVRKLQACYRF